MTRTAKIVQKIDLKIHLNFFSVVIKVWLAGKFLSSSTELCSAMLFPHGDKTITQRELHRWDLDGKWLLNHTANKHVSCLFCGSVCFLKSDYQERHFSPLGHSVLFPFLRAPDGGKTKCARITLPFVSPRVPWHQMLRGVSVAEPQTPLNQIFSQSWP